MRRRNHPASRRAHYEAIGQLAGSVMQEFLAYLRIVFIECPPIAACLGLVAAFFVMGVW